MISVKKAHRTQILPKKHLGQNFLVDPRIIQRIIQRCALRGEETVLEIGPGPGALTLTLAQQVKKFYAVEKDIDLIHELQAQLPDTAKIIHEDILQLDFTKLPNDLVVIGNLPYNISTPIIEKLITNRQRIQEIFMTVQLEFGQRLAAPAGNKEYGALTCFVQYFADVKVLFKISSSCFRPIPKVTSCFVHLKFREPPVKAHDEKFLSQLIRQAFLQRRKKLSNALQALDSPSPLAEILTELKIPIQARAENLSVQDFVRLSNRLKMI